jgi:hypothetical protein
VIPDKPQPHGDGGAPPVGSTGRLHLDGRDVGEIVVERWDASWTYGRFTPNDAFASFATLFGRWSLLMHEDEGEPLHQAASAALAEAERQMDALHARVHFPGTGAWRVARQINIDGGTVEWKEF